MLVALVRRILANGINTFPTRGNIFTSPQSHFLFQNTLLLETATAPGRHSLDHQSLSIFAMYSIWRV